MQMGGGSVVGTDGISHLCSYCVVGVLQIIAHHILDQRLMARRGPSDPTEMASWLWPKRADQAGLAPYLGHGGRLG